MLNGAVFGAGGGYLGASVTVANPFANAAAQYGINVVEDVGGNLLAEGIKDVAYGDDYDGHYGEAVIYGLVQAGLETPVGAGSAKELAAGVLVGNSPLGIAIIDAG